MLVPPSQIIVDGNFAWVIVEPCRCNPLPEPGKSHSIACRYGSIPAVPWWDLYRVSGRSISITVGSLPYCPECGSDDVDDTSSYPCDDGPNAWHFDEFNDSIDTKDVRVSSIVQLPPNSDFSRFLVRLNVIESHI